MFSHQNQQKSSFNENCCTSDQLLTHFKFLILFDRTGSRRYILQDCSIPLDEKTDICFSNTKYLFKAKKQQQSHSNNEYNK